jgi:NADPH-dependent 2,4-dienoyl-CoA reductase/sulfur reductase-like enzyme
MTTQNRSVIIIGGGPAGLAAAAALRQQGVEDILILEREHDLGGILRQCIHDGFGLTRFKEALSGPEYAARFVDTVQQAGIEVMTDITVTELHADRTVVATARSGRYVFKAQAVILAMGCRERTRGAIQIPGSRPAGVYTAGIAQAYMNLKNIMIGRSAVILGSGDIGLIMARRLTLEGASVKGVFEIQPYPSGLPRNITQCLDDYDIPLFLSHTVTAIHGTKRLTGVTVSQVDSSFRPIPDTEKEWTCDTLILSVGLIPENELSKMAGVLLDPRTKGPRVDEHYQTSVAGIFAAGNVLHVHDLVDFVSLEAERLAESVADYLKQAPADEEAVPVEADPELAYTVPQLVRADRDLTVSCRVRRPLNRVRISIWQNDQKHVTRRFRRAIPAEMIHLTVPKEKLVPGEPLKVVVEHE